MGNEAKTEGDAGMLRKYLPLVLSCIAIVVTGVGEYRRYVEAKSTYNQGRIELFKKMAEPTANHDDIMKAYAEIFPRDSIILRNEQRDMAGK
jgi:hypothetical protein